MTHISFKCFLWFFLRYIGITLFWVFFFVYIGDFYFNETIFYICFFSVGSILTSSFMNKHMGILDLYEYKEGEQSNIIPRTKVGVSKAEGYYEKDNYNSRN